MDKNMTLNELEVEVLTASTVVYHEWLQEMKRQGAGRGLMKQPKLQERMTALHTLHRRLRGMA